MLDVFNTPSPQNCDYQEFHFVSDAIGTWVKPRGVAMVRFLLIGAGAGGREGAQSLGASGGGSGSVTSWIGPAMFVPNSLQITVGKGGVSNGSGSTTIVAYRTRSSAYQLLTANPGTTVTAGSAASPNAFSASGIFNSASGQNGAGAGSSIANANSIFLTGGAGGGGGSATAGGNVTFSNYGYTSVTGGAGTTGGNGRDGFFVTQPFIVGLGGAGGGGSTTAIGGFGGKGGIGCGGGGGGWGSTAGVSLGGAGGDGAVYVWAW